MNKKKNIILNENALRGIIRKVVKKNIILEEKENSKEESEFDTSKLKDTTKINYTDNLAQKSSGKLDRGGDIAVAAGVAGGVAALFPKAVGLLSTGVGLPAAAVLAIGAGLYYLFDETSITSEAVKQALDTTLFTRVEKAFEDMAEEFSKSEHDEIRKMADDIRPDKALANNYPDSPSGIAKEIYNATQGGTLGLGIGTNKDEVKKALEKCKSYLGVSKVSKIHAEDYEGTFFDDGDLHKVFDGEFNKADLRTYVTEPIEKLPFIFINTKPYTLSEFKSWIEKIKKAVDNYAKKKQEEPEPTPGEGSDIDYIAECQSLMNQYCDNKNLDYSPIKSDGKWGPKTNRLWLNPYLPHVLENHPDISKVDVNITGKGRWSDISAQLIDTFPGYTNGQRGCYNFCKDALAGNTNRGKKKGGPDTPIKYYGSGGGSGKRKQPDLDVGGGEGDKKQSIIPVPTRGRSVRSSGSRLNYQNIIIDVDVVGNDAINDLDKLAGKDGVSLEFAYDFLNRIKSRILNVKSTRDFQVGIYIEKNKKLKVNMIKGTDWFKTLGIRDFKGLIKRMINNIGGTERISELGADNKESQIVLTINMPQGVYEKTGRLHESKKINKKKLIAALKRNIF